MSLNLTMTPSGGAAPTGAQWRLTYPMGSISSVNFTPGPAATAAGKTLSCANNAGWVDCVVFGVNTNAMAAGVIATAAVTVMPGISPTTAALSVVNPASTNAVAAMLPTTASGGSITVTAPPPAATWSISGNVSAGGGASVMLSGAAAKSTLADASGNYAFSGLANGTYAVSASKSGFTVTPSSTSVVVNGANRSGVNFSAAQATWTISGTLTQGSGATVTLGGAVNRSTTADTTGKYSFAGLSNGSYTVAPWKAGVTFTPSARSVALSGASQTAVDFSGQAQAGSAPLVDVTVWKDNSFSSSSVTSPVFSTGQSKELLLAFVSTSSRYGTETVRGVSGAGLSWTLVQRANTERGTAEIWRAFAPLTLSSVRVTAYLSASLRSSLTVMSFSGVDSTGTNGSGAIGTVAGRSAIYTTPGAEVITSRGPSLVVGVGNDVAWAAPRTVATGQSMVHEFVNSDLGVFWVQKFTNPVAAGTVARIADLFPNSTAFNMSVAEVRGPSPTALEPHSRVPDETGSNRSQRVRLANAITGDPGYACSPGGWASVLGAGLTSREAMPASSVPLPYTLGGVRVEVNGRQAPLLLASSGQVNFQCPHLEPGTPLNLRIITEAGETLELADSLMNTAAPAIFTVGNTERAVVQIAATNQLASAEGHPARAREHVRIYASGLGETETLVPLGMAAPIDQGIRLTRKFTVLWDGQEVEPLFAGLAPGTVGVYQIDMLVPEGSTDSSVPIALRLDLGGGAVLMTQPTVVPVENSVAAAKVRR